MIKHNKLLSRCRSSCNLTIHYHVVNLCSRGLGSRVFGCESLREPELYQSPLWHTSSLATLETVSVANDLWPLRRVTDAAVPLVVSWLALCLLQAAHSALHTHPFSPQYALRCNNNSMLNWPTHITPDTHTLRRSYAGVHTAPDFQSGIC